MSCTQVQLILLMEALERRLETRMKRLGIEKEKRIQTLMEVEKIKQTLIEYGLDELSKQLGI